MLRCAVLCCSQGGGAVGVGPEPRPLPPPAREEAALAAVSGRALGRGGACSSERARARAGWAGRGGLACVTRPDPSALLASGFPGRPLRSHSCPRAAISLKAACMPGRRRPASGSPLRLLPLDLLRAESRLAPHSTRASPGVALSPSCQALSSQTVPPPLLFSCLAKHLPNSQALNSQALNSLPPPAPPAPPAPTAPPACWPGY